MIPVFAETVPVFHTTSLCVVYQHLINLNIFIITMNEFFLVENASIWFQ